MVSTRFAGTDGVTLEAAKLAAVLEAAGHRVAWFAGELGEEFRPGQLAGRDRGQLRDLPAPLLLRDRARAGAPPARPWQDDHGAVGSVTALLDRRGGSHGP